MVETPEQPEDMTPELREATVGQLRAIIEPIFVKSRAPQEQMSASERENIADCWNRLMESDIPEDDPSADASLAELKEKIVTYGYVTAAELRELERQIKMDAGL